MNKSARVDRVLDYIIKNTEKLSGEKIVALAQVIESLRNFNEVINEPNTIPEVENQEELMTDQPFDLKDVAAFEMDGKKVDVDIK